MIFHWCHIDYLKTTALDNKARDTAMKDPVCVSTAIDIVEKIGCCDWSLRFKQLDTKIAHVGSETGDWIGLSHRR